MPPLTAKQYRHKVALIIPTRNRPDTLIKLLKSIRIQSVQPDKVIIVDGSDQPIESQIQQYGTENTMYVHCYPPSLTRQKNEGLKHLNDDITLVAYLDDDIELEQDAILELLIFWENNSNNLGGTSFNIINISPKKPFITFIRKIFNIESDISGKVLGSGFCTGLYPADSDFYCEWLCGGATVWRREIFESFHFDEWFAGWAYHEDADFSYRVAKRYRLATIHAAKVTHNPPPFNQEKQKHLGKMAVINRYYFVAKNHELSILLFYWASCGEIIINIMQSIRDRNCGGIQTAMGNISGIYHIIKGDLVQVDENFRK